MINLVKKMAAFTTALTLILCLGVTVFAADQSTLLKDESISESSSESSAQTTSQAETSAINEETSAAQETVTPENTENPKTGIPAVIPVMILGLAAGGTAFITGKRI